MCPLALALALAAAAPPTAAPSSPPAGAGSLATLADGVAARLGAPGEGRRGLALALTARPPALGPPLAAALSAALGQAGWAVSLLPAGPDAEAAALAAGADWLLRLTAGGGSEGRELVAVGEAVPLWPSFFLQARPGVRAAPPRLVSARVPADVAALLLLQQGGPPAPTRFRLRELARLPYPVLAVAAGEVEGLGPALLVLSPDAVRLLDPAGLEVASRPLDAAALRPLRAPAATAVVGPLGGGSLGLALAGATGGEVLVRRGHHLERAAALPLAPLAAGGAGVLFGAFAPGKAALQDLVAVGVDPAARPRSGADLVAAAASPRGTAPAFAALHPGGRLELLDAALGPAGEVQGVGAGFALADLDGDGQSEVVASATGVGGPDGVRVIRVTATATSTSTSTPTATATSTATLLFQSPPIPGAITCAAAADLTGDGRDDAVLAAVQGGATGPASTVLWLLTTDPREAP